MRGRRLGLLLLVAALIVAGSYLYTTLTSSTGAEPVPPPDVPDVATQINYWEGRIDTKPGITSYTYLAEAHLRAARSSGDLTAYQRAETALNEALAINPNYREARFQMAAVRFALHDFVAAREIVEQLASEQRPPEGTMLLLGDIYLALGDYELANEVIQNEHENSSGPGTLSRLAILADINGDTEQAIKLMEDASEAAYLIGVIPESRAWYEYQVGYLNLKSGDPDTALEWFERADRLLPGYYFAQAGIARALAARGDIDDAISVYDELIAAVPQPEYLAELGDLYTLQGDDESAAAEYDTVEFIAELSGSVYNRQFTLFLLNHDLRVDEALAAAEQDIAKRQDVYAWDTLAWALYKNERYDEAADAAEQAFAHGTQDAGIHYHAGMIQKALGNKEQAIVHLEMALSINPEFDPLQADLARTSLERLR